MKKIFISAIFLIIIAFLWYFFVFWKSWYFVNCENFANKNEVILLQNEIKNSLGFESMIDEKVCKNGFGIVIFISNHEDLKNFYAYFENNFFKIQWVPFKIQNI